MDSVPWHVLLVGAALDLTILVLGWLGARRPWRRVVHRERTLNPGPELGLDHEQVLRGLRNEGREIDRRLATLRAKETKMQRFLGFPADRAGCVVRAVPIAALRAPPRCDTVTPREAHPLAARPVAAVPARRRSASRVSVVGCHSATQAEPCP
jgi:hypothetical protein